MKNSRWVKYSVILLFIIFSLWMGTYVEKLDHKRQQEQTDSFKPDELVDLFWENELLEQLKTSVPIGSMDLLLRNNPEELFMKHGRKEGISNYSFFLVVSEASIVTIEYDQISVRDKSGLHLGIKTRNIYDNTVREALAYFNMADFKNSMDFNMITSEINNRINLMLKKEEVISLKTDDQIKVFGALKLSSDVTNLSNIQVVPIMILKN